MKLEGRHIGVSGKVVAGGGVGFRPRLSLLSFAVSGEHFKRKLDVLRLCATKPHSGRVSRQRTEQKHCGNDAFEMFSRRVKIHFRLG